MGLWGELWFLSRRSEVDSLLAGWCGPDGDNTDFFFGSKGVEVKTSRTRRQHFVSLAQVDDPTGSLGAWLLSIWVKPDPGSTLTVAALADLVLQRAGDRGEALRRLARAGFQPAERSAYTTAFVVLDEPEWFAAEDVPRVRLADPGVSHLRYRVSLDEDSRSTFRRTVPGSGNRGSRPEWCVDAVCRPFFPLARFDSPVSLAAVVASMGAAASVRRLFAPARLGVFTAFFWVPLVPVRFFVAIVILRVE